LNEANRPQSLVLITVDCLRLDHCGFYGYSRPTTPFLDSVAQESVVVPTAIVAGAPTYYSFPSILASRMPLALGRDVVGLAPGEVTLASALRDAGYATAAFSAANPYLSPRFGYHQGFDTFEDFLAAEETASVGSKATPGSSNAENRLNCFLHKTASAVGLCPVYDELYFQYCARVATPPVQSLDDLRKFPSADVVVDRAISWLESNRQSPFFLWLHFMDPHSPYFPTAEAFQDLTGRKAAPNSARYCNEYWKRAGLRPARLQRKKNDVVELYDAGIRSVDNALARFVSRLKATGLWEHCAFALTADHGEEFLDHGGRFHAPVSLFEEVVRVPLMIRAPGISKRPVASVPFSHLHLAPTLLEMLGAPTPSSFQGRSLWEHLLQSSEWNEQAVIECVSGCTNPFQTETRLAPRLLGIRSEHHKMVLRFNPDCVEEVYDLAADPDERKPIATNAAKEARKMLLEAARQHMNNTCTKRKSELSTKARLRDLRVELLSKPQSA